MITRESEWKEFSDLVLKHIREYTVPQYGDKGQDFLTVKSSEYCMDNIDKYIRRHGKNQRPDQDTLDLIKIAHYACVVFFKQ